MSERVIRIEIPESSSPEFERSLIQAIRKSIDTISRQFHGEKISEAEVEIAVGRLYHIKSLAEERMEARIARKRRAA